MKDEPRARRWSRAAECPRCARLPRAPCLHLAARPRARGPGTAALGLREDGDQGPCRRSCGPTRPGPRGAWGSLGQPRSRPPSWQEPPRSRPRVSCSSRRWDAAGPSSPPWPLGWAAPRTRPLPGDSVTPTPAQRRQLLRRENLDSALASNSFRCASSAEPQRVSFCTWPVFEKNCRTRRRREEEPCKLWGRGHFLGSDKSPPTYSSGPVTSSSAQRLWRVWTQPGDQHQRPQQSHGIHTGNIQFRSRPGHLLPRLWSAVPTYGSR